MSRNGGPPALPRIRSSQFGEPSLTVETTSGLTVFGRTTTRVDGDFAPTADRSALAARRRAVVDLPWCTVAPAGGGEVVTVAGAADAGGPARPGDALVTSAPKVALAVATADAAPVLLWSPEGVIGVAHVGGAGLQAGLLEHTADAMRALGATAIDAELGPCLHVECGEVEADGLDLLDALVARFGAGVRGRSSAGRPALDLVTAVQTAAADAGIDLWASTVDVGDACTSCNEGKYFSYRAREELFCMATVIWREDGPGAGT